MVLDDFYGITEYIKTHPHDHAQNVINEYLSLVDKAINSESNVPLGLKVGAAAKEYIFGDIKYMTCGGDFKYLEEQAQKYKDDSVFQIGAYYDVLRMEAPYWLDSFKLYIEKN